MYKVTRRSTLIPFLLIMAIGIGLSIFVPRFCEHTITEIPAFALIPGEIAIGLILCVLLFENASPAELVKLAGWLLFLAFCDGILCNVVTSTTFWLPDWAFKLNWVQLLAFNLTGIFGAIGLFTTVAEPSGYEKTAASIRDSGTREALSKDAPAAKIDFSPQESASQMQDAQEIISQLDHGRIDKLEQSISSSSSDGDHVSLESLFAAETHAASRTKPESARVTSEKTEKPKGKPDVERLPRQPEPVPEKQSPPQAKAAPAKPAPNLFSDASEDIDDLFGNLVGDEFQSDFSPAKKAEQAKKAGAGAKEAQSIGPKLTESGSGVKAAAKEFGKLSAAAVEPPEPTSGTLKTIGQMLLDTSAVERIIKTGEAGKKTKWRILTVDRGANLQALMDRIASFGGVESALLMGKDGLLLSNTESLAALKYVFGPLSLAMHSTTNLGTSKLQMGELRQMVLKTGDKFNVVTDVGSAILAVFGTWNTDTLNSMMSHIITSIAASSAMEGEALGELPQFAESAAPADIASVSVEAAPPAPAAPAAGAAKGGVVQVSEHEMSDLFDNLLADNSAEKARAAAAPPKPAVTAPAAGAVVSVSDNEMSDLFDNLLAQDSNEKLTRDASASKAPANPPPPAPAPQPAPPAPPPAKLMNVSDFDMAELFGSLMAEDSGKKKSEAPEPVAAPKLAAPKVAPPAPAQSSGLLNVSDDVVGDIFDSLLGEDSNEKKASADVRQPAAQPVQKAAAKPSEKIKEFGKLSVQAAQVDQSADTGVMKSIGKQLIDVKAVENIIKAGERREKIGSGLTTARVISAARGEGIKALLSKIDTHEGVIGSLIVGHDGLVIASTLKSGIDKDMMGAMCTAIHSHLDIAVKRLERGKLQQSVFVGTGNKLTVFTTVAVGILAVFVDEAGVGQINGLIGAIDTTVRG